MNMRKSLIFTSLIAQYSKRTHREIFLKGIQVDFSFSPFAYILWSSLILSNLILGGDGYSALILPLPPSFSLICAHIRLYMFIRQTDLFILIYKGKSINTTIYYNTIPRKSIYISFTLLQPPLFLCS